MLTLIRHISKILIPNLIKKFVGRHFTWLSGTLLGFSIAANLFLLLIFAPWATANAIVNFSLTSGAVVIALVSFLGGLMTIHDYLEKRGMADLDSFSTDSDDDGLSSPARGFVETDEERLDRARSELDGWFSIPEGGDIVLTPDSDQMGYDRKGALYVFAARVAFDANERDSPKVSKQELRDEVGFSGASAGIFLDKMYNEDETFLNFDFDPDDFEATRGMDEDEMMFDLNVQEVSEVVQYIKGERRAPN